MKKMVLVPYERYQQLLSREDPDTEGHCVKEVEEAEEPAKQEIQPVPTEDSTGEKVVEPSSSTNTLTTGTLDREHSVPPPPGQPDIPLQRGSGKSKTKKGLWLEKWTHY